MNFDFKDPTILIPVGIILLSGILVIWAIAKLIKKTPPLDEGQLNEDFPLPEPDSSPLPEEPFTPPPQSDEPVAIPVREPYRTAATPLSPSGAPTKDMVERLDTMSQRLNDMQTVLQRQAAAPTGNALTPDTIDKLLKIIGNVTQQVDILQRSLGAPAPAPKVAPHATPAPVATPTPVVTPAPAAPPAAKAPTPLPFAPAPAAKPNPAPPASTPPAASTPPPAPAPGGKPSIGVAGGALSRPAPANPVPPSTPPAPDK